MATLNLQHLSKVYEQGNLAVEDFNIDIRDGEFIVLVGPSGCGKTTTLRMIGGLESITGGKLLIDGVDMTKKAAKDRDIAMVFQNYALYGNMTVYQNMAFSLTLRRVNAVTIHKKVMAAAQLLGLTSQLNKKPNELSGGQRQRVAMGRAIVRNPKVFLFDEPLSNLDAKLRSSMRREIKLLHHKLGSNMVYVTHDQIEALTLADRIVVMSMGHIQQIGTPVEIYNNPANLFVAAFIGSPAMNFFEGEIRDSTFVGRDFTHKLDDRMVDMLHEYVNTHKPIVLGIRPEFISFGDELYFTPEVVEHLGPTTLLHGQLGGQDIVAKVKGWVEPKEGEAVKLSFDLSHACFFDKETTKRIVMEDR